MLSWSRFSPVSGLVLKVKNSISSPLISISLFVLIWILYGLWQQLLLPQVPGYWIPVLTDSLLVKPLLWGFLPCVLRFRNRNLGRALGESWFSGQFPGLACIALCSLSLCFLHTIRLFQGLGNTYVVWDWMYLVFSLSAGIVEEAGFRGCCFLELEKGLGFWPGALISSTLFTLYHYPELLFGGSLLCLVSWRALLIFVMGMVFCWMQKKWNNLALNMVVHTVWDILSYLFCLF